MSATMYTSLGTTSGLPRSRWAWSSERRAAHAAPAGQAGHQHPCVTHLRTQRMQGQMHKARRAEHATTAAAANKTPAHLLTGQRELLRPRWAARRARAARTTRWPGNGRQTSWAALPLLGPPGKPSSQLPQKRHSPQGRPPPRLQTIAAPFTMRFSSSDRPTPTAARHHRLFHASQAYLANVPLMCEHAACSVRPPALPWSLPQAVLVRPPLLHAAVRVAAPRPAAAVHGAEVAAAAAAAMVARVAAPLARSSCCRHCH